MRALMDGSGKIVTLAKAEPDVLYRVIEIGETNDPLVHAILSMED